MKAAMNHKITIQQRSTTPNEYGEHDGAFTTVFGNLWASMEPILGKEYFAAEKIQSNVEIKFRTRWVSGVEKHMRVVCGSNTYEIVSSVNPYGSNRELLLYCKRV